MLVHHFLETSAKKFPDKNAVWHKDQWMTYSEINQKADALAATLVEIGVVRGDRVALLYENCFEYIISYFGILKAGAVVVALNTENTSESVQYLLQDSGTVAVITNKRFGKMVSDALAGTIVKSIICDDFPEIQSSLIKIISLSETLTTQKMPTGVRIISIDLAAIVYTSGSTGKPKGVMLTHQNLYDNTVSIVQYLEMTERDRMMVVLPFYYIYGNSLLTTHFCVGGSLVIDNRFTFPNVVLQNMITQSVTGFAGVPSTFMLLLHKSTIRTMKFESLRYVTQAGGAMAPNVQQQVLEVFAPADVYIMYGTTEAAPRLTYVEPDMLLKKLGSIGKPIPNVDVYVADENGSSVPSGVTGEIVARGSNIMKGYWNDPDATAKVLKNGIYFTGDLGMVDQDGYIFVVGRTKEMIKVGGNRVSSKEIEEALLSIPQIQEVAVIGVEDPILGEAVKAYIVTSDGNPLDEQLLKKELSSRIALFKIPKYFEYRTGLPKNESGKLMKEVLRKESREKSEYIL